VAAWLLLAGSLVTSTLHQRCVRPPCQTVGRALYVKRSDRRILIDRYLFLHISNFVLVKTFWDYFDVSDKSEHLYLKRLLMLCFSVFFVSYETLDVVMFQ